MARLFQWSLTVVAMIVVAFVVVWPRQDLLSDDLDSHDVIWGPSHGSLALRVVAAHDHDGASLEPLLRSLLNAEYGGDTVCLDLFVSQSAQPALRASLDALKWPHGALHVNTAEPQATSLALWRAAIAGASMPRGGGVFGIDEQARSGGNEGRTDESPLSSRCFADAAIVLDSQQEVSPQFYRWAKAMMAAYGDRDDVFGLSLNRLTANAADGSPFRPAVAQPFLSFQPGGGSFVASSRRWAALAAWQLAAQGQNLDMPQLSGASWYKAAANGEDGEGVRSFFSAWLAQYCQERQQYVLFANPGADLALSRSPGGARPAFFGALTAGAEATLVAEWSHQLASTPYDLRHYDWRGLVVPVCGERSCTPGTRCENTRTGYTCSCQAGSQGGRFCGHREATTLPVLITSRSHSPELLGRLLRSLDTAQYADEAQRAVDLSILFEIGPGDKPSPSSKLRACLELAERWRWPHGLKRVASYAIIDGSVVQSEAQKLAAAPLTAFVLLEDDQEVSLQYFRAARALAEAYGEREDVFGFSLNKLRIKMADGSEFEPRGQQPFLSRQGGGGALVALTHQWDRFAEWHRLQSPTGAEGSVSELRGSADDATSSDTARGAIDTFLRAAGLYLVYTNPPEKAAFARGWGGQGGNSWSELAGGSEVELVAEWSPRVQLMPQELEHYGADGRVKSVCDPTSCPKGVPCEDSAAGAVCLCHQGENECLAQVPLQASMASSQEKELRRFSDYARSVSATYAVHNDIILLTASAGFVDFLMNWIYSVERLGITNFIIVAEDVDLYNSIPERYHDRVLLSDLVMPSDEVVEKEHGDTHGFAYNSAKYNLLVGHRPRYISALLAMGFNVLYTDTDTVWLESPWAHFPGGYDMYVQSDAEGPDSHPWHMLCTGFMYMRNNEIILEFMRAWLKELQAVKGRQVNQVCNVGHAQGQEAVCKKAHRPLNYRPPLRLHLFLVTVHFQRNSSRQAEQLRGSSQGERPPVLQVPVRGPLLGLAMAPRPALGPRGGAQQLHCWA